MPLVCALTTANTSLPAPFVGLTVGAWQLAMVEEDVVGEILDGEDIGGEEGDGHDAPDLETALRHHRLVSQLCLSVRALPLRYSPQLYRPSDVADDIAGRSDVGTVWDRVAGRVEMVLRLDDPPVSRVEDDESITSGAAYLRRRAAHYREQQARQRRFETLHDDLVNKCHDLIRAQHYKLRQPHCYSGSFLLEPSHTATFEARLRDFLRPLPDDTTPSLLGPWPPYSFTLELPPTPARRR
ncbi:MAG: GvpL/GvpF family gas vesicle protein [Trueperaceae bacterium]|nr:GvpL/GvpF family gas vesicle protein [Trueperaceae bacterium]